MRNQGNETVIGSPAPVTAMSLMVTEACNFRCSYCYGSYGNALGCKMEEEVARQSVDWLMVQSKGEKNLRIIFFGGEPLMNFLLVRKIADYARTTARSMGKTVSLEITTNASLINDEVIDFFQEYHIVPMISFDGPKEIQDMQRPFRNGKGSYDQTVQRIQKLLTRIPRVSCRATWIAGTDPDHIVEGLCKIGFWKVHLLPGSIPVTGSQNNQGSTGVMDLTPLIEQAVPVIRINR